MKSDKRPIYSVVCTERCQCDENTELLPTDNSSTAGRLAGSADQIAKTIGLSQM